MEKLNNENYYFMNGNITIREIDNLKSTIDNLRPIDKVQENRIMQKFRLDWNYNSNAIEGNSLDYGETAAFLMHGITAKGKPLKDYLDIKGHNEVIDYLLYLINNKEELSERDIRGMHKMLLVEPYETPSQTVEGIAVKKTIRLGEYKRTANHVKTITGEIHYYASAEDTPILMAELIEWYRLSISESKLHPVIIAAIFHHRFTSIHPFDDGNGRMSRLLMNLILMQYGYPPVVIKNTDKNEYYLTLSQADAGNMEPFVNFISLNMIGSLNLYIRGAKGENIEEQSDLKKKLVLFKKELESREDRIELIKSPETVKIVFEKSLLPLFNEITIVLSDFKDLFFEYTEKHLSYSGIRTPNWEYSDNKIIEKMTELYGNGVHENYENIETFVMQYNRFKIADTKFSVEVKVSVRLDDLGYSIDYNFSSSNEMEKITGILYNQWLGKSLGKKFYHQYLSVEDIKNKANTIGEEFYSLIREVFDKSILMKHGLSSTKILDYWDSFLSSYEKLDKAKLQAIRDSGKIELTHERSMISIKLKKVLFDSLSGLERIQLANAFAILLNKEAKSFQKLFVDVSYLA